MAHKGGHGYPRTQQIRKERRERAEQVAAETGFSKLSTKDKLERVLAYIATPGNGEAKKQIAKLVAQLEKEHAKPAPKPEKVEQEATPAETEKPHNRKGKKGK